MKKLKITVLLLSSIVLFSCGNTADQSDKSTENQEEVASYEGMDLLDLTAYNIPLDIYIPSESKGNADVVETVNGSVEISIGKRFGIEIIPFGMSIAEQKEELEGDLVYSIKYLEEDDKIMLYEKSIADSGIDPEYHFFYHIEIDGESYSVKSITGRAFTKGAVKEMMQSATSLKTKGVS